MVVIYKFDTSCILQLINNKLFTKYYHILFTMKGLYVSCILGISCLCLSAETTTVLDFSAGPESEIQLPNGAEWPSSSVATSAVSLHNVTLTMGDMSIKFDKADGSGEPSIFKSAYEESWYFRFYKGNKLTVTGDYHNFDYNVLSVTGELISGYTAKLTVILGQKDGVTYAYEEEPPYFTWRGNNPVLIIQPDSMMRILKLTVTTDGGASSETDMMNDGLESLSEYYTLQGVRVENPSGGMFVRISDGKATKVVIP